MIDRISVLLVLVAAIGCDSDRDAGGDEFADPYMDPALPPSCRDTSTGPCEDTSTGDEPMCTASVDCPEGQVCAASFDGDIGTFRCEAACIATDDAERWCYDDAACCDAAAHCVRGLCTP